MFDVLLLPRRMLIKLDLVSTFNDFAARWAHIHRFKRRCSSLTATALFLAVGVGCAGSVSPASGGRSAPIASRLTVVASSGVDGGRRDCHPVRDRDRAV
jgi:hypothetical protein